MLMCLRPVTVTSLSSSDTPDQVKATAFLACSALMAQREHVVRAVVWCLWPLPAAAGPCSQGPLHRWGGSCPPMQLR